MPDPSPSDALRAAAASASRILLTGPIDPDGDSLGACLALRRGLNFVSAADVDVAGTPSFRYAWMPGAEAMVADNQIAGPYDLAIVLDGDQRRLEAPVERAFLSAGARGLIDHHASTDPAGYDHVLLDRAASSACEMVYQLLQRWGVPLDAELAALLYTGLIFDTGGFRHSNTKPSTHLLAATLLGTGIDHSAIAVRVLQERQPSGLRLLARALGRATCSSGGRVMLSAVSLADLKEQGATEADIEGIVDMLVFTTGAEIACLCIEKGENRVKLSLRSRRQVDVAALAQRLAPGGGGHPRAAGVLLTEPLSVALERLPAALGAALA